MASNMIIVDANGNVIEGASVKRLPSAEVQARKATRKLVGLSDRGRVPETVQALAGGKLDATAVTTANSNLAAALGAVGDALTDTQFNAVNDVISATDRNLSIYNKMQEHNITLDDLSKGDEPADEPADEPTE